MLPTKAYFTKDEALADAVAERLDMLLGSHVKIRDASGYSVYSFGKYHGGKGSGKRALFMSDSDGPD